MIASDSSILGRAIREPVLQFALLAAVLFALDVQRSGLGGEELRVEAETIEFLVQRDEDLLLRELTAGERAEVIEGFIEDEVLVREAYKRGLDRTSRIRSQLVMAMRFMLSEDVPEPTESQLRTFYDENRSRFAIPPGLTIEQVFFSDRDRVPGGMLAQLRGGADFRTVGENSLAASPVLPRMSQSKLVGNFGPETARQILAIEDGDWQGPFNSPGGAHFIRIAERYPERLSSFEETERYLRSVWAFERNRSSLERQVEELKQSYRVVIEDREDE